MRYLSIKLLDSFGQEIFDFGQANKSGTQVDYYKNFSKQFFGLAVKAEQSDKIVAFNPGSSSIIVYNHVLDKNPDGQVTDTTFYQFPLTFTSPIAVDSVGTKDGKDVTFRFVHSRLNFSKITADRSGTPVQNLTPLVESSDLDQRYIQGGIGIVTKLDLSPLLAFHDSVPNALINEAQLVINGVEASTYSPPTGLSLRAVTDENMFLLWSYDSTTSHLRDYITYGGTLQRDVNSQSYGSTAILDNKGNVYVIGESGNASALTYSSDNKAYRGYLTNFVQQLVRNDERKRYTSFILYPVSPNGAKSVNRVVFPKDQIILKLNYTKPLIENP